MEIRWVVYRLSLLPERRGVERGEGVYEV